MTQHYAEHKIHDPAVVREMVETYPFSTIMVNGPEGPVTAQAPLTFRDGPRPAGAIEFHLALANPITETLAPDVPLTVMVQGPRAAISPSWFAASFPTPGADRSRTAPTYNYVSLVLNGRLQHMDDLALQRQIGDLVMAHEPQDGWRLQELAPDLWDAWRGLIRLYRFEIDRFDLTAKLSHGDRDADKPSVVTGLNERAALDDRSMAALINGYDGAPGSLQTLLRALRRGDRNGAGAGTVQA